MEGLEVEEGVPGGVPEAGGAGTGGEGRRAAKLRRLCLSPSAWYLFKFGGLACLMPYIPLLLHSKGLPEHVIGMLLVVRPLLSFLVSPIVCFAADHYGRQKAALLLSYGFSILVGASFSLASSPGSFLLCIIGASLTYGQQGSLADSAISADPNVDYGMMRLWGAVGWGLMNPISGLAQDVLGLWVIFPSHVLISCLALPAGYWGIDFSFLARKRTTTPAEPGEALQRPGSKEWKQMHAPSQAPSAWGNLKRLLAQPEAVAFYGLLLVTGSCTASIESYLFLYLKELGGTTFLAGLTLFFTCVAEVPMFYFSKNIMARFTVAQLLHLTMFTYTVRLFVSDDTRPRREARGLT